LKVQYNIKDAAIAASFLFICWIAGECCGFRPRRGQLQRLVHMKQNVRQTCSRRCSNMPDVSLFHLFTSSAVATAPVETAAALSSNPTEEQRDAGT